MIYLLDSTLRDGGYIIDWKFGADCIKYIVSNLIKSNMDFIELGFLSDKKADSNTTIFNTISDAQKYIRNFDSNKFCLMIKSGQYNIETLKEAQNYKIKKLRYIFKKNLKQTALKECAKLAEKGFELFINPVFIDEYKETEFMDLLKKLNSLNPYAISIVDSMGTMDENKITSFFKKADEILNNNISLCYHAHNNTEHAFLCFKAIVNSNLKRDIIIDSTVAGMGRGAGNICSELAVQHLNEHNNKNYKPKYLDKIIDKYLNNFYNISPWGNSYPYYLSGVYGCHSEYAAYLIKNNIEYSEIEQILSQIPEKEKTVFNKNLIEKCIHK